MTKQDIAAMYADGMTTDDIIKMVKEVEAEQEKKKLEAAEAAKKQEKIKVARERVIRAMVDYITVVTGEIPDPSFATKMAENFTGLEELNDWLNEKKGAVKAHFDVARPSYITKPTDTEQYVEMLLNKYFD